MRRQLGTITKSKALLQVTSDDAVFPDILEWFHDIVKRADSICSF